MQIKIHPAAAANYVQRCYRHARPDCGQLHRPDFEKMLRAVQGQWLDVETRFLFEDQFNTAPVEGVTDLGLRVMVEDVSEIRDDVRETAGKCRWCGHCEPTFEPGPCPKCGRTEPYYAKMRPKYPGGKRVR